MSNKKRLKKLENRLLVDKDKWGVNDNTYSSPPEFYYDIEYKCSECGKTDIWTASQQKRWYEELGKTINAVAKRCRVCRAHIQAIKEEQKRHMEALANKPKHPNEKFFKTHKR
ncbi:zinc-ribbon domain containing protein [Motilimonas sp. KMU-193]|uniref:zinc-ribbon domain containing protein n=1 Tax=Motilimonas sp. KMU-193 TaxID=3388668 RepID=UPI00396B04E4